MTMTMTDTGEQHMVDNEHPMYQEEHNLEQEALSHGVLRYQNNLKIRGVDNTQPGKRAMSAAIEPLACAIKVKLAEGKKARKRAAILHRLEPLAPETLALIATRAVMQAITERKVQNATARLIGALVSEHDDWKRMMATDKGLAVKVTRQLKKVNNETHRRRVASHVVNKYTDHGLAWTDKEQMMAGAWLLEMLLQFTDLAEVVVSYSPRTRRRTFYIQATESTETLLRDGHARCEVLDPMYMPMVIPPREWTSIYSGGYLQRRLSMVKTRDNEYLKSLKDEDLSLVFDAMNSLQAVPYRVNQSVLRVLKAAWEANDHLPDLPDREPQPLPGKPADIAENDEARAAWKRQAAVVHESNAKVRGKRIGVAVKVALAEKLSKYGELYFPHTMDWRGRVYPVPVFLQPQGDDMAKALLQFAEGKPLGEEGVLWFKVHVANLFGVDKVSFSDRIRWVDEHMEALMACGADPEANDFWTTADKPWQALAACFEVMGYAIMGEDYVSHLPIAMDGSCNGLQNLSAMLKDEVGGAATNLIPSDKPADIYTQVAERTLEKLKLSDDEEAETWVMKGISRKLVKRPVMTRPYGVTPFGMRDQIMGEVRNAGLFEDVDTVYPLTTYLAPKVNDSINEIVVAAQLVMDWLQACAKESAKAGFALRWKTPVGFSVKQDYRRTTGTRVSAIIGGIKTEFRMNHDTTSLDKKKQANGLSPNVIHSFDASHMMATVNACVDEGITALSMVHDSYATHACNVGEMGRLLRRVFIDMYSGDVLQDLYGQFLEQVDDTVELPEPPPTGNLDLSQVEDSLYFFA